MKKLGFGGMRFPLTDKNDPTSFDEKLLTEMVDTFIKRGFNYFDTAYIYHNSQSESILKKVLVDRYPRDKFLLADKMPSMILKEKNDLERIFNDQLKKTGAGYFDYYLIHSLTENLYQIVSELNCFEFALSKQREGKIKKLGFSFHDTPQLLDRILNEHPEVSFVQLQINYLDWESENVQSKKCYEVACKHNKEIIIMEPVKGGVLANVPPMAEKMFFDYDNKMSVPSWAIRFAASLDNVIMVLSGMSNMEQVLDNTGYMENFIPLTEEEKNMCFKACEIINDFEAVPCTDCRYCVEGCPKEILIPQYFKVYNKFLKRESGAGETYRAIIENNSSPGECIACGQCETICPQHIHIIDALKRVRETFE